MNRLQGRHSAVRLHTFTHVRFAACKLRREKVKKILHFFNIVCYTIF